MLSRRGVPEIITFLLTFLLLTYFYHEVILHPNDYLFSNLGDGVKNYYSYIYHAKYDSSFWEFSGMNYPYYEHMVYTDGHPLLSYIIGQLGLANYAVGILNMLMMLAYPVCAVIIYRILQHYKVDAWWSIAAAIGITFLAPQVFRMTGHFSLSYPFAVPGMWYLLIKANQEGWRWKWVIGACFYVLAFFFTHPYLGLILALFGVSFWIVNALLKKGWKMKMIKMLIMVLAPIILFQLLVFLTDTHVDRTGEPQGFYDYHARWNSLLVPHHGPLTGIRRMLHLRTSHWETLAYVGMGTIIIFLITLGYGIYNRKKIDFKKLLRNELIIFIIAAWLVLVFSFCFPFKFSFMRWVTDIFGPLKQFRVLGRFAWIFFFVSTIAAVVVMFKITMKQQNKNLKIGLTSLFFGLMALHFFEGAGSHQEVAPTLEMAKNTFKEEHLDPELKEVIDFVNASDYDALMIIPFQHMSSENIMLLANEEANFDGFMLSYHCNKPILNSTSSRMSITEAIQFNNFFSREYVEKDLIKDFPKDDKILIIKRAEYCKAGAMRLIFTSELLFDNGFYSAFDFNAENYNNSFYFDQLVENDKKATVELDHGFRSDTNKLIIYNSFDDDKGVSLYGEGALHGKKETINILHEFDAETNPLPPGKYKASFWYYLGVDAPTMMGIIDQDYYGDRESAWVDDFEVKESTHVVEKWCFVEMEFEWTEDTKHVTIFLNGSGNLTPFYVDELMIYPDDGHGIFKRVKKGDQEYIIYNNDWVKADSFSE